MRSPGHPICRIVSVVLLLCATTWVAADPPVPPPPCNVVLPPLFSIRLTHIQLVGDNDEFEVEFELINYSQDAIAGLVLVINSEGDDTPCFSGASIDANGRPLGPASTPPAGNAGALNDWPVANLATSTRVCFSAFQGLPPVLTGTPIPAATATVGGTEFQGVLDDDFGPPTAHTDCVAALLQMIPGSQAETCGSNVSLITVADPETLDDGPNVLDGFVMRIDGWDPGEAVSMDWFLLDEEGALVGFADTQGPVKGDLSAFGTFSLYRFVLTDPNDTTPGPLLEQNSGFNPNVCNGSSTEDLPFFWAEDQDVDSGVDQYPINPIPLGVPGQGDCFAVEFGHTLSAQFRNPLDNGDFMFEGEPVSVGFNAQDFTYVAPDGTAFYDSDTGEASLAAVLSIIENDGSIGFPTCTAGFSMALRHDGTFLEATAIEPFGVLLDLNGGGGPEFFGSLIHPDGITVGVIYDFMSVDTISFDTLKDVVRVSYDTNSATLAGDPDGAVTELCWPLSLGMPAVINNATTCVAVPIPVGFRNGTIELVPDDLTFVRGDCDGDGTISALPDAVFLLLYLFANCGIQPPCIDACDINNDGDPTIVDPVLLLNWGFLSGAPPAAPFPDCGVDTGESLTCRFPSC